MDSETINDRQASRWSNFGEVLLLVMLFFLYAGDFPPMVNEAHYLVKAKNFWQPEWCQNDLFAASGKAHTTFYYLFGWPTLFVSLETTAWIGRIVGWFLIAWGLHRLSAKLIGVPLASLGVATLWIAGIEQGNLAGEWVIGGIEAKVPAYGLVLLGLAEMVDRNWNRVWPLLGGAAAFHVLSGGWSVIAAMLAWWVTERKQTDRKPLFTRWLFLGGALSLFGLVPALALTLGASSEDSAAAARIYAYFRIRHHLLPADFFFHWYARHIALVVMTLAIGFHVRHHQPWRRMTWFTIGAIAIAVAGLVVGILPSVVPDLAAKLLRYYWFRLTDAVVPLMFGLLVVRLIAHAKRLPQAGAIVALVVAVLLAGNSALQRHSKGIPPSATSKLLGWRKTYTEQELLQAKQTWETARAAGEPVGTFRQWKENQLTQAERQAFDDWKAVCRWAAESSGPDDVFLTPRHQQTFKWYAGRAEVVNWKDVPQDAESLREWYRRFGEVFPKRLGRMRVTIRYSSLREYREKYNVRYMIVDQRVAGTSLPLVKVYPNVFDPNGTYAVYQLP